MKTINIYSVKEAEEKLTELTGNESKIELEQIQDFINQSGKDVNRELNIFDPNIFNSDSNPTIPDGYNWTIEEHIKGGDIDLSKITLYLNKGQANNYLEGNNLRKKLKDKKVLNANVLDYLLVRPELIPEEWKEKDVFFWGTIYRLSDGNLLVRYLYWSGSEWGWDCNWLDYDLDSANPAAIAS